jgi:hypothetical protein
VDDGVIAALGDVISKPGQEPAAWLADSPLVEVSFRS